MLQRRRHRRLDAELIRLVRLAFANAFDLRRMQAEDAQVGAWRLAPDGAQILVLGVNAASQHEGVREDLSQSLVARNLARDVAHDAAKIGLQRSQRALGTVELFGVRVTPLCHERELAFSPVGLAQGDAMLFRKPHEALARAMHQPGVRGISNRLLLHGRIDNHLGEVRWSRGARSRRDRKALLQERVRLLLAHALTPARQRRALEGKLVAKELLAAEELIIRIYPASARTRLHR